MSRFRAVLFDWRGTLAHDPPLAWWVEQGLKSIGRQPDFEFIAATVDALDTAAELPEVVAADAQIDTSPALHRASTMREFELAGVDEELAEAIYRLDFEPSTHPLYPDVCGVLFDLHSSGVTVGVASDIHFDLRPELTVHGVGDFVDAYVLSFEHGVQKPDARFFSLALQMVEARASETLMVGDRATHDGGAAQAGIATLLLPPMSELAPRGLDLVLAMLDLD